MADNVVRDFGRPLQGITKNIASAKLSGQLIVFPLTAAFNAPVALLSKDAGSSEDNVPCFLGNVVVRYPAVTAETGDPGLVMFFDPAADKVTSDSATSTLNKCGRLAKTKINGDTTADIYLNMA